MKTLICLFFSLALAGLADPAAPRAEIVQDWLLQDAGPQAGKLFADPKGCLLESELVGKVIAELPKPVPALAAEFARLKAQAVPGNDPAWRQLYEACGDQRRQLRLASLAKTQPDWVFVKRRHLGGSHYAYTEGQSDAQAERHFSPDSELCQLNLRTGEAKSLVKDAQGVLRDPAVSYDGQRLLFAWKRSNLQDDYHLYDLDLQTGKRRQLTSGLGVADYEAQYLPNGNIIFTSTRCVQTVDCWYTEVSNFYLCDANGKLLRRLGYDQVHTNYPTVLNDGRIVYTRWDYNDRGQIYPQPLFCMYPDGTAQTEFYGNNSWFPTSLLHARAIPGSNKLVAIASGHHSTQKGKLCLVDAGKGRQEASGIQLIAPVRETPAVRVDSYGQDGIQYQYPYPLSESEFVVTVAPVPGKPFGLYWLDDAGHRELLASDARLGCTQPFPLGRRAMPAVVPDRTNPKATTGTYQIQDVYVGPGLQGLPRGSAARIRVVALEYRVAGIGFNYSKGVAGAALSSMPVSTGNGCWDVKRVLGETPIHEDGSACFTAPANTPLYFQVLDAQGRVLQTMRSWSTLMPGETFACIGCHEDKLQAPGADLKSKTLAGRQAPAALKPPAWGTVGFSYPKIVQPILDRHCIACHDHTAKGCKVIGMPASKTDWPVVEEHPFSLAGTPIHDPLSKRHWSLSYLALTKSVPSHLDANSQTKCFSGNPQNPWTSWVDTQSVPSMLPPKYAGAVKSPLIEMLSKGHQKVKLTDEELRTLSCWLDLGVPFCGDYREGNTWTPEEKALYDRYEAKRRQVAEVAPAGTNRKVAAIAIELQDRQGAYIGYATHDGIQPIAFEWPRRWQTGDRLRLSGATDLVVALEPGFPETLIHLPDGGWTFTVPEAKGLSALDPRLATAKPRLSVRIATAQDLEAPRNLALNPFDQEDSAAFPHATTNNTWHNEPFYGPRNAIDGHRENAIHYGWPYQNWGPDNVDKCWLQVDFGRKTTIGSLFVTLRADFPHDDTWRQATLRFSDGTTQTIQLAHAAGPQEFRLKKPVATTWVRFTTSRAGLDPKIWCALTEIEAWPPGAIRADQVVPGITEIVPTARLQPTPWRWTTTAPAAGWEIPGFDDRAWKEGTSGFGTADVPNSTVGTVWTSHDIWLRRTLKLPAKIAPGDVKLLVHHDEDTEITIDGVFAARLSGYTTDYQVADLAPEAKARLKPGAEITLAVHCHQTTGGQFIDVGIATVSK
jgi:hypothetical protein